MCNNTALKRQDRRYGRLLARYTRLRAEGQRKRSSSYGIEG
jgi:hypothetical protein